MSEAEAQKVADPRRTDSAKMCKNAFCKACGWPVVHVCCNDGMFNTPPYAEWDWWGYCSNKTCVKHEGEGWDQSDPDFMYRAPEMNGIAKNEGSTT